MTRGVDDKRVFPLTFASRFQLYPARECQYESTLTSRNPCELRTHPGGRAVLTAPKYRDISFSSIRGMWLSS